jgi:hypothetical protein
MSSDVTVAVAGDPIEADAIRAVLREGGVEARLEAAELDGAGPLIDGPCRVLVTEGQYDRAIELLEDEDEGDEDDA